MRRMVLGGTLVVVVVGAVALSRGWADGLAEAPLSYAGVLEEDGAPIDGTRDLEIGFWDDATDPDEAHRVCATRRDGVAIEAGRFRVGLDAGCAAAVAANPDVWVELRVGGRSLGRSKIGAVPYAVESARASEASGPLKALLDTLAPPGSVMAFAGREPPSGWLLCDGAEISRQDYPALFEAIGTANGAGNGATTFHLPDYRGRFLRGVDGGAGRDPEAAARAESSPGGNAGDDVGSVQASATGLPRQAFVVQNAGNHTHTYNKKSGNDFDGDDYTSVSLVNEVPAETSAAGDHTHTLSGGDPETRPENAGVNFIIRY